MFDNFWLQFGGMGMVHLPHEKGWHRVGLGWLQDVTVQFGFLIRGNGMELDLTPDSDTGAIYRTGTCFWIYFFFS